MCWAPIMFSVDRLRVKHQAQGCGPATPPGDNLMQRQGRGVPFRSVPGALRPTCIQLFRLMCGVKWENQM
jgi:hypothetical protein